MRTIALRAALGALIGISGCSVELGAEPDHHGEETPDDGLETSGAGLSLSALGRGCSTAGTEGISAQLLDEMACLSDGALVRFEHPNVVLGSARVHPYLSPEGRDMLLAAAGAGTIEVTSALRTIAEQYVLSRACSVAAAPGRSNHETGRAIDVANHRAVGRALEREGFDHPLPSRDPVHYEAPGEDLRRISALAFQRLWNANHPEDRIAEDGVAGRATLDRLARAPAEGFAIGRVCTAAPPAEPPPAEPPPAEPPPAEPPPAEPPSGVACVHSFGGTYADTACSASYQCCAGTWRARSGGCGPCACTEETGRIGCTAGSAPPPPPAPPPGALVLPPRDAGLDYQLGGPYAPRAGVSIVVRDRTASPAPGLYNVCYVNGFQIQPSEESFWAREHPELILRDSAGRPIVDAGWDEMLIDVGTPEKRAAVAAIVGEWIAGCARDGFDAVEIDNLDSFSRSAGRLDVEDAVATMRLFSDAAHAHGLAIAQKNSAEIVERRAEMGTDFAVVESCNQYAECDVFTAGYGDHVLVVEYRRADFDTGCRLYPGLSIVLRDVPLTTPGGSGYVHDGC